MAVAIKRDGACQICIMNLNPLKHYPSACICVTGFKKDQSNKTSI